jgi:hypothetical protein
MRVIKTALYLRAGVKQVQNRCDARCDANIRAHIHITHINGDISISILIVSAKSTVTMTDAVRHLTSAPLCRLL